MKLVVAMVVAWVVFVLALASWQVDPCTHQPGDIVVRVLEGERGQVVRVDRNLIGECQYHVRFGDGSQAVGVQDFELREGGES